MDEDVNTNSKLFWKEISKVNGGKVKSCSRIRIKDINWNWERIKCKGSGRIIMRISIT